MDYEKNHALSRKIIALLLSSHHGLKRDAFTSRYPEVLTLLCLTTIPGQESFFSSLPLQMLPIFVV